MTNWGTGFFVQNPPAVGNLAVCFASCSHSPTVAAVGAENARTGKTMAEKMLKIMEERLKEKAAVTDKLHSKNHALKVT